MNLIGNTEIRVVEYQGKRVITTAALAALYGASEKNIQDNFSNNASRFTQGEHYFKLEGTELKDFKSIPDNIGLAHKFAPSLILWTEKGASRHSKILDTEQSWAIFDKLENAYFNPPILDPLKMLNDPATLRGLLLAYDEKVLALEQEKATLAAKIEEDAPKVEFTEEVTLDDKTSYSIRQAAKILKRGWFALKVEKINGRIIRSPAITGSGLYAIRNLRSPSDMLKHTPQMQQGAM